MKQDISYFLEYLAGLFTALGVIESGWYLLLAVGLLGLRITIDTLKENGR